jgi:hypothetical protein
MKANFTLILFKLVYLLLLANLIVGCSILHNKSSAKENWTHSGIFLTDQRLINIKLRIQKKIEPTYKSWVEVLQNCNQGLLHSPQPAAHWAVPAYYEDKILHEKIVQPLQYESRLSYELSLCYRLTDDERYSKKSAEIINAWSTTLKTYDLSLGDTKLSMSESFSSMILAADLLKTYNGFTITIQDQFKDLLRKVVLPLNTMDDKKNNHANWGLLLVLSSAAYLDDLGLLERAESRYKELIAIQIEPDGTLLREIDRSNTTNYHGGSTKGQKGIWYTNYALSPTTLSAEILNINGRNVYSYKSSSGGSLKAGYEKAAEWSAHPETFPYYKSNNGKLFGMNYVSYFEILNMIWPNENAKKKLRELRPLTVDGSFPHLTLTHGDLGADESVD